MKKLISTGLFLFGCLPGLALAKAGDLDAAFGVGGMITTTVGAMSTAYDVAVQEDGKIVAVGEGDSSFAVARYNADGSLDTGFDGDGILFTAIPGDTLNSGAYGVEIQADQRIVVAGYRQTSTYFSDLVVVRYLPDGSLDASFDGDGVAVTEVTPDRHATGNALVLQADGKILVAGKAQNGASGDDVALVRFKADGSLDSTFDQDGIVLTDGAAGQDAAFGIALQEDKIAVGGKAENGIAGDDLLYLQYGTDGSLVTKNLVDHGTPGDPSSDNAYALAVGPTGKAVLGGFTYTNSTSMDGLLVGFNASGGLDASFGQSGTAVSSFVAGDDYATALAIQPADGKILTASSGDNPNLTATNGEFILSRRDVGGGLDGTFGDNGVVFTSFSKKATAYAVALQKDGKILVAGADFDGFALARYLGDPAPVKDTPKPVTVTPTPSTPVTDDTGEETAPTDNTVVETPAQTPTEAPAPAPEEKLFIRGGAGGCSLAL